MWWFKIVLSKLNIQSNYVYLILTIFMYFFKEGGKLYTLLVFVGSRA